MRRPRHDPATLPGFTTTRPADVGRRRNLILAAALLVALSLNLALLVRSQIRPGACRPYIPPAELQTPAKPTPKTKGVLT